MILIRKKTSQISKLKSITQLPQTPIFSFFSHGHHSTRLVHTPRTSPQRLATRIDILSFHAVCNSFKDFPFPSSVSSLSSQLPQQTSAFINTCVEWKETPKAHEFKANLPGLKKEEVKVEIEDDMVLQISGERNI
ncbi:hypothetical protein Pint_07137 [Pistacia integerrima]|uniref:Uncharacterized protein n=1 Tax=Pistacia integerrima TaxID=434235 RepID=A0ACC0XYR7_9ROSI|nr:hypothetical protein Pint_07137 [Pistacia integerrima]